MTYKVKFGCAKKGHRYYKKDWSPKKVKISISLNLINKTQVKLRKLVSMILMSMNSKEQD